MEAFSDVLGGASVVCRFVVSFFLLLLLLLLFVFVFVFVFAFIFFEGC